MRRGLDLGEPLLRVRGVGLGLRELVAVGLLGAPQHVDDLGLRRGEFRNLGLELVDLGPPRLLSRGRRCLQRLSVAGRPGLGARRLELALGGGEVRLERRPLVVARLQLPREDLIVLDGLFDGVGELRLRRRGALLHRLHALRRILGFRELRLRLRLEFRRDTELRVLLLQFVPQTRHVAREALELRLSGGHGVRGPRGRLVGSIARVVQRLLCVLELAREAEIFLARRVILLPRGLKRGS